MLNPGSDGRLNVKPGSVNVKPNVGIVQLLIRPRYGAMKTVADGSPSGPDVPKRTVFRRIAFAPR